MAEETVRGREVTVIFDGSRCIHSRNCVLAHPEVFVPGVKGDWIRPDAAPAEAVVRVGLNCPSGAIRVIRNDGGPGSDVPPKVNTLRLRENGPLAVEGQLVLNGAPLAAPRATLCRCGASARKPFCDGSHDAAGFRATGEPEGRDSPAPEHRDGPLAIEPQENGPLKITGNLEVLSGTGRRLNRVGKAFFCRCGQSRNKPYCDGSHKAAGFAAPA